MSDVSTNHCRMNLARESLYSRSNKTGFQELHGMDVEEANDFQRFKVLWFLELKRNFLLN